MNLEFPLTESLSIFVARSRFLPGAIGRTDNIVGLIDLIHRRQIINLISDSCSLRFMSRDRNELDWLLFIDPIKQ